MKMKLAMLLIITSMFLASSVTAADVCCEKLAGSDDYCIYTDKENCEPGLKNAAVNCEQTSFCEVGCCYSSDEGECYKNVGRAQCGIEQGTWTDSPACEIAQCQKGCCVLGSQGFFVTEVRCKLETSKYGNVTMQWKSEIASEPECQAEARSQDMGCCVTEDVCQFIIRDSCPSASIEPTVEGQTGEDAFYKDMLCSNDLLKCGCAKQTNTRCYNDKVYWFDSCGNRENIYSSDKEKSYNKGYVLDAGNICDSPAILDPDCGNCDYGQGSICRSSDITKTKPKFGNNICSKTSCDSIYDDKISPSAGEAKKNGESWCLYDSAVGKASDLVGSRHYRHLCINGEEMNEPCMDYREEICIQGVLGSEPTDTFQAFQATGDYIEAACRDNRWEDCMACKGEGDEEDKKCCENEALRDCHWMEGSQESYCVPEVPPGLQFWSTETEYFTSSTTRSSPATTAAVTTGGDKHGKGTGPSSNAESVCSQANQECTVVWKIGGTGRLGVGGLGTQTDWECVLNCQCIEKDWVIGGNNLCKAQGDCGAYFNILGRSTMDGYANTASEEKKGSKGLYFNGYELQNKDLGDWRALSWGGEELTPGEGGFFSSMGEYVTELGVPLTFFAIGAVYGKLVGTGFVAGTTGGLGTLGATFTLSEWGTKVKGSMTSTYGTIGKIKAGEMIPKGFVMDKSSYRKLVSKNSGFEDFFTKITSGDTTKYVAKEATDDLVVPQGMAIEGRQPVGPVGGTMGTVNTIMWLYTMYKLVDIFLADTEEQTYTISCAPWVAPVGGNDCKKCNEDPEKQCSIYRCKSLGQNCYLVNPGTSEEKCINLNPNDVNTPIIEAWEEVIPDDYTITPAGFEGNKGYKINEKIGPYDSLTLGITTDEPAQCKFTDKVGMDFDEMTTFFGDSQYLYEHQITFVVPPELTSKEALRKIGDTYNLYIRCKDAAGNKNERDYFIRFTLKPEPDMTPPVIEGTSIAEGAYMLSGVTETEFSVYVNERADCKYSMIDKEYAMMENSFECSTSPFSVNSVLYGLYECKTNINFAGMEEYKVYIRCKDKFENKNQESYVFSLQKTPPLQVLSFGPSGTFYELEVVLKAATSGGAENGKAICAYSTENTSLNNMIGFLNTDSTLHEQPLTPGIGEFTYYIRCIDIAGNIASDSTTFTLDIDMEGPKIIYIYVTPSNYLHLEMDELSTCEYSNKTFSYGTGKGMTGSGTIIHELQIMDKVYHIICQDVYENEASFIVYP